MPATSLSRLGIDVRVGIGTSITVAATASEQIEAPGGVLAIDPDQTTAWPATLPVEALHGIRRTQRRPARCHPARHCPAPPRWPGRW
ncbi:predicted protein [Streptomyces viridochromogenes DSM 40736]|uniref:Predicted protein n=1 Tax=Streptomyces viridochromogenes (strain DSM 40736 / JCM 4977 / BCRC 1201 / Tue 494) TaxID=591159 RepID=D9XHV8_STRVT|nr:predicted protein [Streptomyces viridochromogenes DSM 40736]